MYFAARCADASTLTGPNESVSGLCLALPQQEVPHGEAPQEAVKELQDVLCLPLQVALEAGQAQAPRGGLVEDLFDGQRLGAGALGEVGEFHLASLLSS
jgi:hypothetical protein